MCNDAAKALYGEGSYRLENTYTAFSPSYDHWKILLPGDRKSLLKRFFTDVHCPLVTTPATAVSSRMRSYEEKHYILTSKAENEWQLKPRNSISPLIWFLRAHSEGHEWARNGPGMGPEIIQAASKNPRLRNVKNRYSKVPLIHACEIGVSVRCLHGIWHLAFAKIPWLWPKISSVSRNILRKSEERVSTKGHQVLISQKYLIAEGRPESEVRSLRRSNGFAKETKLCFAVMGTNIARNSSAIEQTATEYKCPALLPSFSYNYLTSTTTSSEQINIASALTTFNQQLMQQTGSSNSGSSLLWLQKLPSHLLAVAHTSIKVVSQQPFRLPFLTPLLQLQLKFCPTWHSGWLPNRYETCFFTNKVKKCYGCTLEFPDKYPRSHSESIRCFLNSNQ